MSHLTTHHLLATLCLLTFMPGCLLFTSELEVAEEVDMSAMEDLSSPDLSTQEMDLPVEVDASGDLCAMEESCDTSVDDDCDGAINEGCACSFLSGEGVCSQGTLDEQGLCSSAQYDPAPLETLCGDGLDNNCDGITDEGCACEFKSLAQGVCAEARINAQGACDAPLDYVLTEEDLCDGLDNDCDGITDEGCGCLVNELDEGVCDQGVREDDGMCQPPDTYLDQEFSVAGNAHCDGLDNDCDGITDEGCVCDFAGRSQGVCTQGIRLDDGSCDAPSTFFAELMPGDPEPLNLCDGLDNDCDGQTDEGCPTLYDDVTMGEGHVCALTRRGEVECQGRHSFARLDAPAGPFESLEAGASHTCALRLDGTPICWGRDDQGQSSPPAQTTFSQLASFRDLTCGIRSGLNAGTLTCWGDTQAHPYGNTAMLPVQTFSDIALAGDFGCGIIEALDDTDGKLLCWGNVPDWYTTQVTPLTTTFTQVELDHDRALTSSYGCAIDATTNEVSCWGDLPEDFALNTGAQAHTLRLSTLGACILDASTSELACTGRLNTFSQQDETPSMVVNTPLVDLEMRFGATCTVSQAGELTCWGTNTLGELGPLPNTYDRLDIGEQHRCGTLATGDIECVSTLHPDGLESTLDVEPFLSDVMIQNAGHRYTCGLAPGNICHCWGIGTTRDDSANRSLFTLFQRSDELFTMPGCVQIDGGVNHICAVNTMGRLDCIGDTTFSRTPPAIDPTLYQKVVTTRRGTCGLSQAGEITCWGQYESSLNAWPLGVTFEDLTGGEGNVCALDAQGTPSCTGVMSTGVNDVPPGLTGLTQLVMGTKHACGLETGGGVTCWGLDNKGQSSPPPGMTFTWLSAAYEQTCGLVAGTSEMLCW